MLLGELFSVSAAHQRSMQVAGRGQAQGLLQQYLARRIVGEIFAPNHMRDALGAVVHHHGQLVGPQAIGAAENEVTDAVHDILLLSAADVLAVLKEAGFEGPVVRLREPDRQADGHDCAASVVKPVQVQALFGAIEHALGLRA